ncbi:MAG TPA: DUF6350 family protein, partial [Streptomyces sp.]|nr:DUF6350 family protein [Streptomyces sp.]
MHLTTRPGVPPRPSAPLVPAAVRRVPVPPVGRLLDGVVAACLGLGGTTVVVLLLWITSPYPDSGPGGALRIAADLWLMSHGAPLVRTDTLSGTPAPVGLTPLLLCAAPLWLLHRAARGAVLGATVDGQGGGPRRIVGGISTGYLLVAVVVTGYAASGPLQVDPLSAALRLPVAVVGACAAGAWTARGRPVALPGRARRALGRVPAPVRTVLNRTGLSAVLRAAAAATAALCAGGALLTAGALLWQVAAGQRTAFPPLPPSWSGYTAVLLLSLALAPNAAVWGAAYGLGPGFTLGGGSVVGPLAVTGLPPLPPFPLLAALPAEGSGTPVTWVPAGAVPLAAGLVLAWHVARTAAPARGRRALGRRETACTAWLAACGCAAAMALLAVCAGGPLGTGALAHVGPQWWQTGPAALAWTAVLGVPGSLALRAWRLRRPRRADVPRGDAQGGTAQEADIRGG